MFLLQLEQRTYYRLVGDILRSSFNFEYNMVASPPTSDPRLRLNSLYSALAGRGVSVFHQTTDHVFDLVEFSPLAWPADSVLSKREADFMEEATAASFVKAVTECVVSQTEQSLEFNLVVDGKTSTYQARILPDPDGATTILSDITEQRSREAALASLLREVSHRSKNLLAIIQSVAMQTAHHSGGIQEFLDKFRGRLHALSSTQDLVTESDWRGTNVQALVRSQLSRVGHSLFQGVRITGENPVLGPNASLHVGLAIHELAANAAEHGGKSVARNGEVSVDVAFKSATSANQSLVLQWTETGIDPVKKAAPPRFGTLVLERIVPLSVGGSAAFAIDGEQVTYRLVIPGDQFEA